MMKMRTTAQEDFVKSLIKLQQQEYTIEKSLENFTGNIKIDPELLKRLRHGTSSCITNRRQWSISLRGTIVDIRNDLRAVKILMDFIREGRTIDMDSLKEKLVALSSKIQEFKKDSSFEKLAKEETVLDQDLRGFFSSLAKYEIGKTTNLLGTNLNKTNKDNTAVGLEDYEGIRDFEALIMKTGHTQNWSDEDHLLFLKIRDKTNNVPAMVAAIRKKCPDLSVERIVNHQAWYKIYLDLREKQRYEIKEWRRKKEFKKRFKIKRRSKDEKNYTGGDVEEKIKNINNEEFVPENVGETTSLNAVESTKAKVTSNKKQLLDRWRTDKENTKALESEEAKLRVESRRAWKERRRLTRANEIKAAVVAYREQKMKSLTSSSATSSGDSNRVNSKPDVAKLIRNFQNQDEEFVKRKKALIQSKISRSTGVILRPKTTPTVNNTASSLLKPTKVWLERCKAEEDHTRLQQKVVYVKDIPKLAMCDWSRRQSTINL